MALLYMSEKYWTIQYRTALYSTIHHIRVQCNSVWCTTGDLSQLSHSAAGPRLLLPCSALSPWDIPSAYGARHFIQWEPFLFVRCLVAAGSARAPSVPMEAAAGRAGVEAALRFLSTGLASFPARTRGLFCSPLRALVSWKRLTQTVVTWL